MMALGLSACICYLGTQLAGLWAMPSQSITIITGITVAAATILPKFLAPLAPSAEGLALLMMQVRGGAWGGGGLGTKGGLSGAGGGGAGLDGKGGGVLALGDKWCQLCHGDA